MAQVCEITGVRPQRGHKVSHANNKSPAKWHLNLQYKKYAIPALSRKITVRVTTRAIRTIDRFGDLTTTLLKLNDSVFSDRLKKIKRQLLAQSKPKKN